MWSNAARSTKRSVTWPKIYKKPINKKFLLKFRILNLEIRNNITLVVFVIFSVLKLF